MNLGIPVNRRQISVHQVEGTRLLEVIVQDNDPNKAALIANGLVDSLIEQNESIQNNRFVASEESLQAQIAEVEAQIAILQEDLQQIESDSGGTDPGQSQSTSDFDATLALYRQIRSDLVSNYESVRLARVQSTPTVVQVEEAIPAETYVEPQILRNVFLGMLAGLLVMGSVLFLIEYLDDSLKTPDDIERVLGLPVIGFVSILPEAQGRGSKNEDVSGPYVGNHPRSMVAEAFRGLRTNLDYAGVDEPLKTILITSPGPGEGKTTVATNLAVSMAQGDRRVVLMDCDLRLPSVHEELNMANRRGLSDYFLGEADQIQEVIQSSSWETLSVLTSGDLPPNPTELLDSKKMELILDELRRTCDYVVIDSPPFIVTDSVVLATKVDGVLLIVRPGRTHATAAKALLEQMNHVGARVVGVVLNRIPRSGRGYYGDFQYYYASYYESDGNQQKVDPRKREKKRRVNEKRRGLERLFSR
jgi:non-specific protein-tyrosine kinase